jgi:hypothetical protein
MSGKSPWAPSVGLVAGYCALAAATAVAVLTGGTQRPGVALALLAVTGFAVGTRTQWWVAMASGGMGWLFYDGFIAGRHAHLAWHGGVDVQRLGLLAGVAVCGTAASWLHRLLSARAAGPLTPATPVTDLAEARTARRGLTL